LCRVFIAESVVASIPLLMMHTYDAYIHGSAALKAKLESVSDRYSCGDLIFDDDDEMSKLIVESETIGGFLLGQDELRQRKLTGGYKCFPICVECRGSGKKVV